MAGWQSTAAQVMAGDEETLLQPSCSLHWELPGHQARGSSLSIPDASGVQGEQVKKKTNNKQTQKQLWCSSVQRPTARPVLVKVTGISTEHPK